MDTSQLGARARAVRKMKRIASKRKVRKAEFFQYIRFGWKCTFAASRLEVCCQLRAREHLLLKKH